MWSVLLAIREHVKVDYLPLVTQERTYTHLYKFKTQNILDHASRSDRWTTKGTQVEQHQQQRWIVN